MRVFEAAARVYTDHMTPTRALRVVTVFVACLASNALAFNRETHFDLTLYLSLKTPCLSFADAAMIASADWSQDTNQTTVAEKDVWKVITLDVPSQRNWHAFESPEVVRERANTLWKRVESASSRELRLVYLGQLLHFTQDTISHRGYAAGYGHAFDTFFGHDPDSLAWPDRGSEAVNRTLELVRGTTLWLERACALFAPGPVRVRLEDQDVRLFESLVMGSDVGWRAWRFSGTSDAGLIGERRLYGLMARAFDDGWWPAGLTGAPDPVVLVDAYLDWLHVIYDANGEPTNVADLADRLERIRRGELPPNLPVRSLDWSTINVGC